MKQRQKNFRLVTGEESVIKRAAGHCAGVIRREKEMLEAVHLVLGS